MEERNRRVPRQLPIKKNVLLVVMTLLFFVGMIYGVLMLQNGTSYDWFRLYSSEYVTELKNRTLLQNFFSSFTSIFFYLLAAYMLGYSAIAQPAIFLIPLFRGLGIGSFMGYLYSSYGFRGIGYCALIVVPAELVALFAIMIACRESFRLSVMLFSEFIRGRATPLTGGVLKLYHIKFLVLCIFAIVSALMNTIGILLFLGLFHFQ